MRQCFRTASREAYSRAQPGYLQSNRCVLPVTKILQQSTAAIPFVASGWSELRRGRFSLGFGATFCGVYLTVGETSAVMADPLLLEQALLAGCVRAIGNGAEAMVIGGGPLAVAARAISARCPVPLVEPIPAAVHLAHARACELSLPECSAL